MTRRQLVRRIKQRWRTERVYEDAKGELGLDHYEGRSFRGWNHHVSIVLVCFAFVVAERSRAFPPSTGKVANDRNSGIRLCPLFDPGAVAAAIDGFPDTLAADDSTWTLVYDFEGKPAWLWPHGQIPPPPTSVPPPTATIAVSVSVSDLISLALRR